VPLFTFANLQDLRKEVKAKRPQDLHAYIIRYCQAMQKGEPPPETVDELPGATTSS
jgi:hypothetical protein